MSIMPVTAVRKALLTLLAIALLGATPNCAQRHHVVYRFVLPKDYIGWVRVDFEVKDAPELAQQDIRRGAKATVIVPQNGVVETSSIFIGSTWESYELYYRDDDRLVPIPKTLYSSKFMLDGFSTTLRDDTGKPKALSWYFLIGPKSLRAKYPIESYLKEDARLPQPGPMVLTNTP